MSRERDFDSRAIALHLRQEKFPIGRLVVTRSVLESIDQRTIAAGLDRHRTGDWGSVDEHDQRANDEALLDGGRLLSAYEARGTKFWIMTEADRSSTTVLFPEEY